MNSKIRRILVPLDTSEYAEAAVVRACEIARTHGATLSGLVILDTAGIRSGVAPADIVYWPLVEETILTATADARAQIASVKQRFAEICEAQGVQHEETQLDGVPADLVLHMSVLYDLVVIGTRTFFHFGTQKEPGHSLAKILDRTSTPILASPLGTPKPYKQVVVAYDGSFASGRALRDFMAFAEPYEPQIRVVTAQEDERQARILLDEAAGFLKSHGVKDCETIHVRAKNIMPDYFDSTDLIVAGIHSRKFIRDLMVGSLVTDLLEQSAWPVFLSH